MARGQSADEDGGDRRAAILAAALACFNEQGIEATPIGAICARAGASVGSVYHHFGSKEGIAIALLAEGLSANAAQLEARLRGLRSARAAVQALVGSLVDWIGANPEWARYIYAVSAGRLAVAGAAQLREVNARYAGVIERCFGPHLKAGAFRRLPRECFASLALGPVHDYARRWLAGQVATPIAGHKALFADAAWEAIRRR